jgi:two-component system NtrC family response regulator
MTANQTIQVQTPVLVVDDTDADKIANDIKPFCTVISPIKYAGDAEKTIREAKEPFILLLDLYLVEGNREPSIRVLNVIQQLGCRATGQCGVVVMSSFAQLSEKLYLYNQQSVGMVWDKRGLSLNDLHLHLLLLERQMAERRQMCGNPDLPDGVIGSSPGLIRAYRAARLVAHRPTPVLIHGETGTGKEALAQYIHDCSRPGTPFVPVACGSLGDDINMQLSEMFGHRVGAFAGATRDRPGKVREAKAGTILFDDVQDLRPETQAALLRFLQTGEYTPVGGDVRDTSRSTARIIVTINEPPDALIGSGRLQGQFIERVSPTVIELPPLRERGGDDILLAAAHFCREYWGQSTLGSQHGIEANLSEDARAHLLTLRLERNFRQLRRIIWNGCLNAELDGRTMVTAADLSPNASISVPDGYPLRERYERMAIEEALRLANQNRTEAAQLFGLSRPQFYRVMKEYGIGD